MINLVTKTDFATYKYFANSIKAEQSLDQSIQEAQLFDIKKWLGDAFLHDLCSQKGTSPESLTTLNEFLLSGGNYTYEDETYSLTGLKSCIIYYSIARYIKTDSVKFTATGIVKKEDVYSQPIDDRTMQSLSHSEWEKAEALRLEIIQYLNRFETSYPLWGCMRKKRTTKFHIVGQ